MPGSAPIMRPAPMILLLALCASPVLGAADLVPINSICPVTCRAVDRSIPPVLISTGKGEHAVRLVIAVADAAAAERVKANPEAYIAAAKANRQADIHD